MHFIGKGYACHNAYGYYAEEKYQHRPFVAGGDLSGPEEEIADYHVK